MNGDLSILIHHIPNGEIIIVSIYIDNFFFTSNCLTTCDILKETLSRKYNIKDLREILIIIGW